MLDTICLLMMPANKKVHLGPVEWASPTIQCTVDGREGHYAYSVVAAFPSRCSVPSDPASTAKGREQEHLFSSM